MENKKPLVIIPPYSEPLKKLGAILASPEESAQTEIYVVDDLKEAGQLIPTLGQCLIVIANAKKCALFLQENRWAISKNHSKVILMTPKEIPQKTLMKFLKIGLTEVILETLPPKSLLYKIKLLLRSIKGQKNEKDENINVKSMLDMSQNKAADEQQRVEKGIIADEAVTPEFSAEKEKRMELDTSEDSLDYLKSKKKNVEENVIDTHWKTMKKAEDLQMDMDEDDTSKTKNESEEISTYYKTDRDTNIELDIIDDQKMRGKASGRDEVSDFSIEKLKRQALEELDLEDSAKNNKAKKAEFKSEDDEEDFIDSKVTEEVDLKNDKYVDKKEEIANEEKKKEKSLGIEETVSAEKKKHESDNDLNHIDNYYKGKINQNQLNLEEEKEDFVDKKEKDTEAFEDQDAIEKAIELESSIPDFVEKKKSNLEEKEDDERKNNHTLDQVSSEDAYMRGKLQTQQMQLEDEDFFDKKETTIEEKSAEKKAKENANAIDEDKTNHKKAGINTLDNEDDQSSDFIDKEEVFTHDNTRAKEKAPQTELELDHSSDLENGEKVDDGNNLRSQKLQRLALEDQGDEGLDLEKTTKEDARDPKLKKLNSTQFDLENGLDHNANGNGQVEHLDKYMRSRDSKSQDQDWNLGNKKKDVDLQLEKSNASQVELNLKNEFKDAGEITIDYRKLKEEFELLKEGENLNPEELEKLRKSIRGESDDDDSSIRVYLPEPKNVDFTVEVAMDLMDNNVKPKEIWEKIARKIHAQKGYVVFFQYSKPNDLKEAFSLFQIMDSSLVRDEVREKYNEMKKDSDYFKAQANYSLANWRCPEVLNAENKPWEDIELPQWAEQELQNKAVEYIYPMYDGLDRMGHIYVWFPEGIIFQEAKFIDLLLESSRALYLEQIIRSSNSKNSRINEEETTTEKEKNNFFSGITSLFGKKKVG